MPYDNTSPLGSRSNSSDNLYALEYQEGRSCGCTLTNLLSTITTVVGAILLTIGMIALYTHFFPTTLPFLTKTVTSYMHVLNADLLTFSLASIGSSLLLIITGTKLHSCIEQRKERKMQEELQNL